MKTYETVLILDERLVEDGGEAILADVEKTVTALGGTVKEKTSLGRKTFARQVRKTKASSGIYWDVVLDLPPEQVDELKERYRLNKTVLRIQVMDYVEPPENQPVVPEE